MQPKRAKRAAAANAQQAWQDQAADGPAPDIVIGPRGAVADACVIWLHGLDDRPDWQTVQNAVFGGFSVQNLINVALTNITSIARPITPFDMEYDANGVVDAPKTSPRRLRLFS